MTDKFLQFHVADIGDEEIEAVVATLRSGWLTTGPRAREFETAFAAAVGARYAVALNSATAALHLGLDAVGVSSDSEVVVPTMTFAATAEVVGYFKARPVLVDCDPETLTVRAEDIEPAITPRTRAVIPVDIAGLACDLDPIISLARRHGIATVEDAAHAFPSAYKGRPIGSLTDLTAFSFYATKTITTGEGGMLTTDNQAYADRARMMSLHGISRNAWNRYAAEGSWWYDILEAGFKYNLTDIAAALGLVQLRRANELLAGRARVAARYDAHFAALEEVRVPARRDDSKHAWSLYPIRLRLERLRISRADFIEALRARGIGTSVHFVPLHHHPYYRLRFGYPPDAFPNANAAFQTLVSLPIYSRMTDRDVDRVAEAVRDLVEKNRR